jgi:hypothetical protein
MIGSLRGLLEEQSQRFESVLPGQSIEIRASSDLAPLCWRPLEQLDNPVGERGRIDGIDIGCRSHQRSTVLE